jgi:hypothetical protein
MSNTPGAVEAYGWRKTSEGRSYTLQTSSYASRMYAAYSGKVLVLSLASNERGYGPTPGGILSQAV